tara:strand:+ start:10754 stop:11473 length:720 start_codon:yes stop_codon:yes gene_type:complete
MYQENIMENSMANSKIAKTIMFNMAWLLVLFSVIFCQQISAKNIDDKIQQLSDGWAHVNFELNGDDQEDAFMKLIVQAKMVTSNYPKQADAWTWSGIIKSSFSEVSSGLNTLLYAKSAKKDFEQAIALNPKILAGSAYISLGVLYHKMPGWPIAFGDDDEAEVLLIKGLENDPNGKVSNFFYGEFLFDEDKYHQAKRHLLRAKQVPLRVNCLVADKHRQDEVELLLAKVEKKIAQEPRR